MAGENATWYFARVWEDEESRVFFTSQDYEYERNAIMLVAVTVLVYAVGRFATYAVEHLLLLNFPSLSREWCFTSASQNDTKLKRTQDMIIKTAAAVAFIIRWPLSLLAPFPVHLWQTLAGSACLLTIFELSFVVLLALMVSFIRIAHHTAQITGWEHPNSPARAFAPGDYSKQHRQFVSPAIERRMLERGWSLDNSSRDTTHVSNPSRSTSSADSRSAIKGSNSCQPNGMDVSPDSTEDNVTDFIDTTQSSFMGFSPPMALNKSITWLRTREFASSIFSTSTTSTNSSDSFGGLTARDSGPLRGMQWASGTKKQKKGEGKKLEGKKVEVPDLLTGSRRG